MATVPLSQTNYSSLQESSWDCSVKITTAWLGECYVLSLEEGVREDNGTPI